MITPTTDTDRLAEADREYRERVEFTSRLGFGDDKAERAAHLPEIIDNVEEAFAAASAHDDCPVECPGCGERLADKPCEWCHGSGCGPGTASGAYEECSNCGGDRLVHEGCAERSYADLVAERNEALAEVARLQERLDTAERQVLIEQGRAVGHAKAVDGLDAWRRNWKPLVDAHMKRCKGCDACDCEDGDDA